MSGEIKFKVWTGEKMVTNEIGLTGSNGFVEFVTFHTGYTDSDEWENYKFMRHTGLTDKYGVEIYEGDILKLSNFGDFAWVQFWQGEFITMVVFKGKHISRSEYDSASLNTVNRVCSVVGNIHKNPEILNYKKKEEL